MTCQTHPRCEEPRPRYTCKNLMALISGTLYPDSWPSWSPLVWLCMRVQRTKNITVLSLCVIPVMSHEPVCVVVITGCSQGGIVDAIACHPRGCCTDYATARCPEAVGTVPPGVHVFPLEVTDAASSGRAASTCSSTTPVWAASGRRPRSAL